MLVNVIIICFYIRKVIYDLDDIMSVHSKCLGRIFHLARLVIYSIRLIVLLQSCCLAKANSRSQKRLD